MANAVFMASNTHRGAVQYRGRCMIRRSIAFCLKLAVSAFIFVIWASAPLLLAVGSKHGPGVGKVSNCYLCKDRIGGSGWPLSTSHTSFAHQFAREFIKCIICIFLLISLLRNLSCALYASYCSSVGPVGPVTLSPFSFVEGIFLVQRIFFNE